MPAVHYRPWDRRQFLKAALLGGAALVTSGHRGFSAAAGDDREFRLALLSDTHIPGDRQYGHRGFNPWVNLKQIVPDVVKARPEGVVINGDAARLDGQPKDYEELRALLEPIASEAPVYIGLGNHDDRANFHPVFTEPPGLHPTLNGKHTTVIEHPVVRLIVLDSLLYVNKTPGLVGREQRAWLKNQLPEWQDRPIVIMVHHTLGDGDGELLDVERLFEVLRPHPQVKSIIYGHSHVWALSERERIKLINLPAVGYNFQDKDPVGWVEAAFRPEGVDLILHAIAGNRAEDGKATTVRWNV
jgi:3',5'-cyclic AMP phosphodiesterase CpdA